ncbi:hypothetical protein SHM7688_00689 [Shimia marina]|uniref:Uncharacterized protein n=1 Tax=Shimia marina TaxID=321267 RepID=A0A0P1ELH8_9RHOB|nr:hypothetical protein SHM7688_00689 [Shimia marina]
MVFLQLSKGKALPVACHGVQKPGVQDADHAAQGADQQDGGNHPCPSNACGGKDDQLTAIAGVLRGEIGGDQQAESQCQIKNFGQFEAQQVQHIKSVALCAQRMFHQGGEAFGQKNRLNHRQQKQEPQKQGLAQHAQHWKAGKEGRSLHGVSVTAGGLCGKSVTRDRSAG